MLPAAQNLMEANPKISVIIPSYNRDHLILKAVESVSSQTYSNLEIIVVDDGSTDNTSDVISEIDDPRLIYIKHNQNRGLSAARNTGILAASGDIFAFLDTDDLWIRHKLNEHVRIFNSSSNISVVYSGSYRYKNNEKIYIPPKCVPSKHGKIFNQLLFGNFIPAISVTAKRECFDKVGLFDPALISFEDWDMWIRLAKNYLFYYIPSPLNIIYFTHDSLTANQNNFLVAEKIILKKHYDSFSKQKKALAKRYAKIAILYAYRNNFNKASVYFYKAGRLSKFYAILAIFIKLFRKHFVSILLKLYEKQISQFFRL